ncbi:hypothetical protein V2G26_005254 [Clonostachys chloroleuca]
MTTAVRTGGPGGKIRNSGANAAGSAWVTLDNVKAAVENLIGRENHGFAYLMTNFNKERFLLCMNMNSYARVCLEDAWAYSIDRHTFAQPLFGHQVTRHKLATMARVVSRIALCKVQGGRLLELANREAQQIFGGNGYQRGGIGGRVEQISQDSRMSIVGGGSEEIIADLAVRQEMKHAEARGSKL